MNKKVYTIIGVITLLVITLGATYAYFNVVGSANGGTGTVSAKSDEVGNVSLSGDGGALHINLTHSDVSNVAGGVFYGTATSAGYVTTEEKLDVAKIEATALPDNVKYTCTFDIKVKPAEGNLTNITSGEILFSTSTINIDGITTDKLAFSSLSEEKNYHASTTLYSGDINYLRVSARITSSDSDSGESWLNNINGSFSVSLDNLKCTASKEQITEESNYTISGKMVDENGNALSGYAVLMSEPRIVSLGDDGSFEFKNVEPGTHNIYYMGSVNPESLSVSEIKSQAKTSVAFKTNNIKNQETIKLDNRSKIINISVKDSVEVNINVTNGTSNNTSANIAYGTNATFIVTPSEGYKLELESDTCNGTLNSETGVYTVSNVTEEKICNITLKKQSYKVTNTVSNGTVSVSELNIPYGESKEITVTPNSNYYLSEVSCSNGYTTNAQVGKNQTGAQTITITNNNSANSSTCIFSLLNTCAYQTGNVWNFSYSGSSQQFNAPCNGTYKLEVWGAQGGDGTNYSKTGKSYVGGRGGYSYGNIDINKSSNLYIQVGGQGISTSSTTGGYNGGGGTGNTIYNAGTGGGATHIATTNRGTLNNYSSYKSELLLVAGGGGGGGNCSIGGAGGGLSGITPATSTQYSNRTAGSGGTQTSGYSFGLGQGGNSQNLAGGGGGGYYGGGQGDNSTGGGGGSGYVNSSTLLNCATIAGNQSFTSPSGGTETGHSGNGYARITLVSLN